MEISNEDGECQVESVVTPNTKKGKQARLPFQTLKTDSPASNNKKRKSVLSPDVRHAKLPKINLKENSCKNSDKSETEDIVIVEEEVIKSIKDDSTKESTKNGTPTGLNEKNKKPTSARGKGKKSESKVQANSLTNFFRKLDNKQDTNSEVSSPVSKNKQKEANDTCSEIKSKTDSEESADQDSNGEMNNQNNDKNTLPEVTLNTESGSDHEDSKKSEESNDVESRDSFSSKENQKLQEPLSNYTAIQDIVTDSSSDSDGSDCDDADDDDSCNKLDNNSTNDQDTDCKEEAGKKSAQESTPTRKSVLNTSGKEKKCTPKQLEKKLESAKKREMKQKQRLEREKKLQEERENRKRELENRKKEKEEKRKEREEKEKALKEQKQKEKEMKEMKKQAEIELKQKEKEEERRRREEAKEAKEEERRKREEAKEEEKRKKEEEKLESERKKQKAASNFVSFFVPKKPTENQSTEEKNKVEEMNFMPFEIKADMRVASLVRRNLTDSEKSTLDNLIKSSNINKSKLYIAEIKNEKYNIRKSGKTWPREANDDVIIIEDEEEESVNIIQPKVPTEKRRAKLFLFHENRRPPYWGTWRKESKRINPRRPLEKDTQFFDYEVDSDDEWEEEEPGESINGSDDEKDKEEDNVGEDNYDIDNDFMVPHGYLSDEEIVADEEDDDDELNPEKQKTNLKLLNEEFEAERKTKTMILKPRVIGCIWLNEKSEYPENTPARVVQFLTARHAWVGQIPISLTAPADADPAKEECGTPMNKNIISSSARKAKALEESMPDLIRLLHGNLHGRNFLIKEFCEFWNKKRGSEKTIAKSKLMQKIQAIAKRMPCPEPGPIHEKYCWWVSEESRAKYLGNEQLSIPNNWTYCLTPKKKTVEITEKEKDEKEKEKEREKDNDKEKDKEKEKKTVPLITQFTKTLTAEEKQKQLGKINSTPTNEKILPSSSISTDKPSAPTSASSTPTSNRKPKRVSLISVPRGEPLPKSPRVSLMDKFVTKDNAKANNDSPSTSKAKGDPKEDDMEDCMIIDSD